MESRNFLVFGGSNSPYGGMDDFKESFSTKREAFEYCKYLFDSDECEWTQVWDNSMSPLQYRSFHKPYTDVLHKLLEAPDDESGPQERRSVGLLSKG